MTVFWVILSYALVEIDRRFRDALMMEAVSTSEMSVNFYQTTQCNIPEETWPLGTWYYRETYSAFKNKCM
jgi:hypothetical protein